MGADTVCEDANVQFSQMGNFYFSGRNGKKTNQEAEQHKYFTTPANWSAGGS